MPSSGCQVLALSWRRVSQAALASHLSHKLSSFHHDTHAHCLSLQYTDFDVVAFFLGGDLTPKNTLIPQPLPAFVTQFPDLLTRLESTGAFTSSPHGRPNHIILNEYLPGQGIMPHEDGPSYHPVVATLSLGSHAVFHYYHYYRYREGMSAAAGESEAGGPTSSTSEDKALNASGKGRAIDPEPVLSVLLERRSLVVTTRGLYEGCLHGIDGVHEDVFAPADGGDGAPGSQQESAGMRVANAHLLAGEREREVVLRGGTLEREARYSLTCRDVARVSGLGPRGLLGKR